MGDSRNRWDDDDKFAVMDAYEQWEGSIAGFLQTEAAKGVTKATLYNWLAQYGRRTKAEQRYRARMPRTAAVEDAQSRVVNVLDENLYRAVGREIVEKLARVEAELAQARETLEYYQQMLNEGHLKWQS